MDIQLLHGHTWWIDFPAAVGVYVFSDHSCLLIDSGASDAFGRRVHKIIDKNGYTIRALFNTHAHGDHCGGNRYLQQATGCEIYASSLEAAFMANPLMIPYGLYSASPIKALKNKFLMPEASRVDHLVVEGDLVINETSFRLLALPGHSLGQLGMITPDGVLFAGDSLISREKLSEFPFLYVADVGKQLESLDKLRQLDAEYVFLSHGGLQDNIAELIDVNYRTLMGIVECTLELLTQPRGREEILPLLVEAFKIPLNRNQYFLTLGTLSACLTYLCDTKQAKVYTEDNRLFFNR
jgi:glyoxylase-like metal-dependent hydrolase (beta-lactamase superfamily II)